jgi:CubicO group peptidase (beta-lactamase class C family)
VWVFAAPIAEPAPLDRYFEEKDLQAAGDEGHVFLPARRKGRSARYHLHAGCGRRHPSDGYAGCAWAKSFSGAGGLSSTAPDYVPFCRMLLNGGQLDGTRWLSRKTVELMTQNHNGPMIKLWDSLPGERFGLGFSVRTDLGESANLGWEGVFGMGGAFDDFPDRPEGADDRNPDDPVATYDRVNIRMLHKHFP